LRGSERVFNLVIHGNGGWRKNAICRQIGNGSLYGIASSGAGAHCTAVIHRTEALSPFANSAGCESFANLRLIDLRPATCSEASNARRFIFE
jgi:hypothetical protein